MTRATVSARSFFPSYRPLPPGRRHYYAPAWRIGLGIGDCAALGELHGGTIKADSAGEGRGATFTIKLPLAPQDTTGRKKTIGHMRTKEASNGRFTSLPSLDGVKVLLVDDDPDMVQILSVIAGRVESYSGDSKFCECSFGSTRVVLNQTCWFRIL